MNRQIRAVADIKTTNVDLMEVALGQADADLVLKGGLLLDVYSGKIRPADIAIKGDRIALVGDVERAIGKGTRVTDASGRYITPGLIDVHVHFEASMLTPTQFARAVLPLGNTTVLWETLWTGNTLGVEGIKFFLAEAKKTPLKVFATATSGVPPTSPNLATPGHTFTLEDMEVLLSMDQVLSLGEIGRIKELLQNDPFFINAIQLAQDHGKRVDGSIAGYREQFPAFRAAGITSDHEGGSVEDAVDRIQSGMRLIIREGSGLHNLPALIRAVTEHRLEHRRICFCVDDKAIVDVMKTGAVDYLVRKAIQSGVDPVAAVQMATLNGAEYLGVDDAVGGIAPGMIADMVLVRDLQDFRAHQVIANGQLVASEGTLLVDLHSVDYPPHFINTVKINRRFATEDFTVPTKKDKVTRVRIIHVIPGEDFSFEEFEELPVSGGEIALPEDDRDILRLAVIDRHGRTPGPNIGMGFVKGFGLKEGALASCIAPDINPMITIGRYSPDMAVAANRVVELQGGVVLCKGGQVLAEVALPVAGFMTSRPYEECLPALEKLHQLIRELGCKFDSPVFAIAVLGIVGGHPYIKMSDMGLIDILKGELVPLEVH